MSSDEFGEVASILGAGGLRVSFVIHTSDSKEKARGIINNALSYAKNRGAAKIMVIDINCPDIETFTQTLAEDIRRAGQYNLNLEVWIVNKTMPQIIIKWHSPQAPN